MLSLLTFANIKRFGQLIIILALLALCGFYYVNYKTAKANLLVCDAEKKTQDAAILEWKKEGEEAQARYKEAQKAVAAYKAKANKEDTQLLTIEPPSDCEAAIQWGINYQLVHQ